MDDLYGPPLPPGYVRPNDSEEDSNEETESKNSPESNKSGASKLIGPQIPKFLSRKRSHSSSSENEPDVSLNQEEARTSIGPQLPPELQNCMGGGTSDDDLHGPLPAPDDCEINHIDDARVAIEKRAKNMRDKLDNKDLPSVNAIQREEWMTVPDTSRKNQLGAISRCLAPEKASSKSKKHSYHNKEKDRETTEELKKYNKSKRSESLLEMHKKSKNEKDKKSSKDKLERKAFDRDEVSVKQFSKQQVNSVIDKAKYLDSRFSKGNQQYL